MSCTSRWACLSPSPAPPCTLVSVPSRALPPSAPFFRAGRRQVCPACRQAPLPGMLGAAPATRVPFRFPGFSSPPAPLSPSHSFLLLLVLAQRPRSRAVSRPVESSSLLPRVLLVVYPVLLAACLSPLPLLAPLCPCKPPALPNQTKVLPAKCTLTHAPHLCSRSRLTLASSIRRSTTAVRTDCRNKDTRAMTACMQPVHSVKWAGNLGRGRLKEGVAILHRASVGSWLACVGSSWFRRRMWHHAGGAARRVCRHSRGMGWS